MASLLSVRDLQVAFPNGPKTVTAVDGVSFDIAPGEIMALVGESGSGKSVTALAAMGLLPASARIGGEILYTPHHPALRPAGRTSPERANAPPHVSDSMSRSGGKTINLRSLSERRWRAMRGHHMGMVFQEPLTALNPLHSIGKQIDEMLRIHQPRVSAQARLARVQELLAEVGLEGLGNRLDAYPHQLSGGQRQRVMLAMAMSCNPRLLIADEPTTALDVTVQQQILDLIRDLQKRHKMAVLLITHDLTVVRKVADRVAVMQRGKLLEVGPTRQLFAAPEHPYTKALLAAEPKGDPPVPPSMPEALLTIDKLSVSFPREKSFFGRVKAWTHAVKDASLEVNRGTTLGIVGESGSGKTTLAMALLRLAPSKGTIVYQGWRLDALSLKQMRPLRSELQVVFQDPFGSLNPRMSVGEIIEEGLKVHARRLSREKRAARVAQALEDVGLTPEMADRYPHEFSGGQRQRIAIARALALRPQLVVLDEPTSALDLSVQAQVVELLRGLQEKYRLTYLFISHDLRVVKALSHELIVMKDGEIIERGLARDIFAAPRHDYTRGLMRAAFDQDAA